MTLSYLFLWSVPFRVLVVLVLSVFPPVAHHPQYLVCVFKCSLPLFVVELSPFAVYFLVFHVPSFIPSRKFPVASF